jgi:hypothetical protein
MHAAPKPLHCPASARFASVLVFTADLHRMTPISGHELLENANGIDIAAITTIFPVDLHADALKASVTTLQLANLRTGAIYKPTMDTT